MNYFNLDVLGIGAHPDDIEFCCPGVFLVFKKKGYKTGIIDLTRAELSTRGDTKTRAEETDAASKLLGLTIRENLDIPDGWINPYSHYDQEATLDRNNSHLVKVVSAIRRLRPEIIITPYDEERHPDHVATSQLVTKAIFLAGLEKFKTPEGAEKFIAKQVIYFQMRYAFRPSFIVDVSDVYSEKQSVINCYKSQLSPIPDPAHPKIRSTMTAIESRDRYYGALIGTEYGEPFYTRNTVGIADPVSFYKENPYCKANFCLE